MSQLPQSFLDELRARTTLSTLIGKTVRLKRSGGEYQACCPFHDEKTPSFYVNDAKEFYHCFGCGAHGDAIRWLTDHEGREFLEAVKELADLAGMRMPERERGTPEQRQRESGLHAIMVEAEGWYAQQLAGIAGAEAREYLAGRNVSADAIREFGIGFAPDGFNGIRRALAHHGDGQLLEAGLLARREDGGEPYDRFRGRIMFPIRDAKGRTISFGGRILGKGEPKYLNGPESPLFDKGRSLFNLDRAAQPARKAGRLIVVEGYMDVIALATVGIDEAVAPLGTALTERQLGRMWRIVETPTLCFDGDSAGRKAAARAAHRAFPALQPRQSLAFAPMPSGADPDDVARSSGRSGVEAILSRALPMVDFLFAHEHDAQPLNTPEARAGLRQRLVDMARSVEDRDVGRAYEQEFWNRLRDVFGYAKRKARPELATRELIDADSITRKMVTAVLRGLARHPSVAIECREQIVQLPVSTEAQREAMAIICDRAFEGEGADAATVDALFPDDLGWRGLMFRFTNPTAKPEIARADLCHLLDGLVAVADKTDVADMIEMAHAYQRPSEARKSALF